MFFTQDDKDRLESHGQDISQLFRLLDNLGKRVYKLETVSDQLKGAVRELAGIINNHADKGNEVADNLNAVVDMVNKHSEAIELVVKGMGKDIEIKPAVPATITVTPGEPEKMVLVKAKKVVERKPQPLTVQIPASLMPEVE